MPCHNQSGGFKTFHSEFTASLPVAGAAHCTVWPSPTGRGWSQVRPLPPHGLHPSWMNPFVGAAQSLQPPPALVTPPHRDTRRGARVRGPRARVWVCRTGAVPRASPVADAAARRTPARHPPPAAAPCRRGCGPGEADARARSGTPVGDGSEQRCRRRPAGRRGPAAGWRRPPLPCLGAGAAATGMRTNFLTPSRRCG